MYKYIIGIALAFSTAFAPAQAQESASLPNTAIQDLTGKKVEFNTIFQPGKVTLVSIWATWCMPCIKEIKNINSNLSAWQAETPDFNYVTISIDDARAMGQWRSMVKSQKWTFPAYLDQNAELKRSLNFETPPFTFIVDKKGQIAFMHSGYEEGGEFILYEEVKKIAAQN